MPLELERQGGKTHTAAVNNGGAITSSDGGLVVLSSIEQRRRWIRCLSACLEDRREADRITSPVEVLLRQ